MTDNNEKKSFIFCIILHQPNLATPNTDITNAHNSWNNDLFPAITHTYIPLLKMFDTLVQERVPFRVNMVITPTLCALLDDYIVQEHYTFWLENLINLGEKEVERTQHEEHFHNLAKEYLKELKQIYSYFVGECQGNLLIKFKEYAKSRHIEFLATAIEHCYLPHYIHLNEFINAQIEAGIIAHRNYFGLVPNGFWLPLMGYTNGLEKHIQKYRFDYTVLDTHGFLFANPEPTNGIFTPMRCNNSLAVFANDYISQKMVFGSQGFIHNHLYRNQNRDIGFESAIDDLHMVLQEDCFRYATGFKYWANGESDTLYNIAAAKKQAELDAGIFVKNQLNRLEQAADELPGKHTSLVCVLKEQNLGRNWHESIYWLSHVLRKLARRDETDNALCNELITQKINLQKAEFFMSSFEDTGYAENLLTGENTRFFRLSCKVAERMTDLANRFPRDIGLREYALNLAARQTFFATSSDWVNMPQPHTNDEPDLFTQSVLDFLTLFESCTSNSIDIDWITKKEKQYPLFPWINYRMFLKKR
ncbi:MAG: 1,4-alpha-glucan branching protein domain-containing protein [Spirochaetales bacterium]